MIDTFFHNLPYVISGFMLDWIAHLTDLLDGVPTAYAGGLWGDDHRRWFNALSEISAEQLEQIRK